MQPTNKDEVFFTVVNFLIMVVSFALAVYEIYRMVTVVIKIIVISLQYRNPSYLKQKRILVKELQ